MLTITFILYNCFKKKKYTLFDLNEAEGLDSGIIIAVIDCCIGFYLTTIFFL
jgi:hypothetical protein